MTRRRDRATVQFPDRDTIVEFIRTSPVPVGKREIARKFGLGIEHRGALKSLLRELEETGAVERGPGRRLAPRDALPEVTTIEVTGMDLDGELMARPVGAAVDAGEGVRIYVAAERSGASRIAVGTRMLARLTRVGTDEYQAKPIRVIEGDAGRVVGVFMTDERIRGGGFAGRVVPTDRRQKTEYRVAIADAREAQPGELVVAEVLPKTRLGLPQAAIVERLGDMANPRTFSLVAIHTHGIPIEFPPEAIADAEAARPVGLEGREDLRGLPLVTIDGADARDFDDAVWAEPAGGSDGGWNAVVAIADVAHYVRPGSPLDREARRRGNSVYFPDRVVPMLPEALSNELCSLRPNEPRACLAVHLRIDAHGQLIGHRFVRGLMRSTARLTYEQVQSAIDGNPDDVTGPLLEPVIRPLYGVFAALNQARAARGTLDLDLPERQVLLGPDGHIDRVVPRRRYDSHKLIEELMIAANVAAAEAASERQMPCLYRIHDAPDPAKVEALRPVLDSLGLKLARGQVLKPRHFNDIISKVAGTPHAPMVHDLILRSQAQAQYRPENIGHFGLALRRYAHFTSPIRRYADLVVHRALIEALRLGEGGGRQEVGALDELGDHLSQTERRAALAERESVDRYTAAYLSERIGTEVSGRIGGVARFGLFVTLSETGADGLVPVSTLPGDFYDHDTRSHALVGRRWGRTYRLGEAVRVRIVEADPMTGGLVLALLDPEERWSTGAVAAQAQRRRAGQRPPPRDRRGR
ncbi:RNAse R [Stella humosa]|uniref:Ribonuclease R n=1 Tax=Stella humosa TaxID=94 RepID=A0A3N1KPB0_9PROT|nr:ribonuclease R [Stella humosa]ROP81187.1 RNAse R [Stella humosa]BBK32533.1 ribonuclease R [Stella humosa]